MAPWLDTIGIVFTALFGVMVGSVISRSKKIHWVWGYFIPLALLALLLTATYISAHWFIAPLAWLSGGRTRFVLLCLAITSGATSLILRLHSKLERAVVFVIMLVVLIWSSVLPFLVPALIRNELAGLTTKVDENDICLQSTDYTCGPAAAVTALRRLGLSAQEGEIAILSHTSPVAGTLPWCLYKALDKRYSREGLLCRLQYFDSIEQLPEGAVTLAIVRDAFLLDHCVAVLDVTDKTVTFADPVFGKERMSHKKFERIWRFYGIVLSRPSIQSI